MKIAIVDKEMKIEELSYEVDGVDCAESIIGTNKLTQREFNYHKKMIEQQKRCDEMEKKIGDRQVIESLEWKCYCVGGLEDVMDMYEELLKEYIAKKAV